MVEDAIVKEGEKKTEHGTCGTRYPLQLVPVRKRAAKRTATASVRPRGFPSRLARPATACISMYHLSLEPLASRHVDAPTKQQTLQTSQNLQTNLLGGGFTLPLSLARFLVAPVTPSKMR